MRRGKTKKAMGASAPQSLQISCSEFFTIVNCATRYTLEKQSMKKTGRYDTSGLVEGQFEPGSRRRVLRNLLGINRKRAMAERESLELLRAQNILPTMYGPDHRFTAADIQKIHHLWLSPVYEWAGQFRQVNISKGNFFFPPAIRVPGLMESLERKTLARFTPCLFPEIKEVVQSLAVVHTELVLIHPFREGNGRTARVLATLMALQAGLPPLNFDGIRGKNKQAYFAAVQAGMDYNYQPMEAVFEAVISRSLRSAGLRAR